MMSAELLGTLERVVSAAVRARGTYKKRSAESQRAFGGVNVVMCADFWQLHPVTGTSLASNPLDVLAGCAHRTSNTTCRSTPMTIGRASAPPRPAVPRAP